MKRLAGILAAAGLWAYGAGPNGNSPRVSRSVLGATEKSLDQRVLKLWSDNPFVLLGTTRGLYLEGYGAVFTAEINLVTGPTMIMRPPLTKEEIAAHKKRKTDRLPQLRQALKQMLVNAAASLDTVPQEENIVIGAFLWRYPWEDVAGFPSQLVLQAQRKKLLEVQRAGGAGLDAVIRIDEF